MRKILLSSAALLFLPAAQAATPDYTRDGGVFVVNEDWYGHQNSTINYLTPDDPDGEYWHYRVFQQANPGMELGCTNQFGALYDGRLFLIAKQDKDPGSDVTGGRITVAKASTMECLAQLQLIDPTGKQCDGRAFLGVTPDKGYISTSNGVWVFDLNKYHVTGQIAGTENPNAGDDKPNSDPTSSLYFGQCGSMVMAGERVFVAHQSAGVIVIDPESDTVTDVLRLEMISDTASPGSVVKSSDGNVWVSVATNDMGYGDADPYLVRINPKSLEMKVVAVPEGMYPPTNSWYAWTPDGFCASKARNALYWNGGENSWFSNQHIYRYDIDKGEFDEIIDLDAQGEGWSLYGCSMRVHPVTDEIYISLFQSFASTTYTLRRTDHLGNTLGEYPMISNYWFPSVPVFPELATDAPTGGGSGAIEAVGSGELGDAPVYYTLSGVCAGTDRDALLPGLYIAVGNGVAVKVLIK